MNSFLAVTRHLSPSSHSLWKGWIRKACRLCWHIITSTHICRGRFNISILNLTLVPQQVRANTHCRPTNSASASKTAAILQSVYSACLDKPSLNYYFTDTKGSRSTSLAIATLTVVTFMSCLRGLLPRRWPPCYRSYSLNHFSMY